MCFVAKKIVTWKPFDLDFVRISFSPEKLCENENSTISDKTFNKLMGIPIPEALELEWIHRLQLQLHHVLQTARVTNGVTSSNICF